MTAAEKILKKSLVGADLSTAQWNQIQAGIRDRAFFSAHVTEAKILEAARKLAAEMAAGGVGMSEFHKRMRDRMFALGYQPSDKDKGTIKDLYSQSRLNIIAETNVAQARGYVQYCEANTPGAIAAFPAQELVRTKTRKQPRDWRTRWIAAGGKVIGGNRMVALKDDQIWIKISAFGNPFPPFDFNSGMGLRDVGRKEAIDLGLITADELRSKVRELDRSRTAPSFNANLQSEVSPESAAQLRETFGDQVAIVDGVATWQDVTAATETLRLPSPSGLVAVSPAAIREVPAELAAHVPALLRDGGKLELLSGGILTALVSGGVFQGVRLSNV